MFLPLEKEGFKNYMARLSLETWSFGRHERESHNKYIQPPNLISICKVFNSIYVI